MATTAAKELVLKSQLIYPGAGATLSENLSDCYKQLTKSLIDIDLIKSNIVKQTIFISIEDNTEYIQIKQKLLVCATDYFDILPPTSVIAQSPENGSLVLEITYLEGLCPEEIIHWQSNSASFVAFKNHNAKMLIATSIGEPLENADILKQSTSSFNHLENILKEQGMEFSDIIRQWNYIEQITKNSVCNNAESQHYQIFNDVRSKYYNRAVFSNGYPAATGIGQDFGGVIIDIIAVKTGEGSHVVSVKSPVQLDAYAYSNEVLAENNTMNDFRKTTPKFERAKILFTSDCNCIFVSGTAAIKGQVSIPVVSVEEQTEMTIKNILSLISPENLVKQGVKTKSAASLNHLRVYVKYRKDLKNVESVCLKYFPLLPAIYLVADICRPELLVEIEGQAIIY